MSTVLFTANIQRSKSKSHRHSTQRQRSFAWAMAFIGSVAKNKHLFDKEIESDPLRLQIISN